MKLLILVEVDVSQTLANTIQRNGFILAPDGTKLQVKIPNSPAIPQRKTKVLFVENPSVDVKNLLAPQKSVDKAEE